jgi:hypothetical protein
MFFFDTGASAAFGIFGGILIAWLRFLVPPQTRSNFRDHLTFGVSSAVEDILKYRENVRPRYDAFQTKKSRPTKKNSQIMVFYGLLLAIKCLTC